MVRLRFARPSRSARVIALAALFLAVAPSPFVSTAFAQNVNPVYMDDSSEATDTFLRVQDHLAAKNLGEAARVLQVLLTEQPDRLVLKSRLTPPAPAVPAAPAPAADPAAPAGAPPADPAAPPVPAATADPDLFVGVRSHVHRVLLDNPELLERYRQLQETTAQTLLAQGFVESVETSYLLTTPGFDAALSLARRQLERAQFNAAFLTLRQLESHPDAKGERAAAAGRLAAQLACYLETPAATQLALKWGGTEAGKTMTRIEWPKAALQLGTTPLQPLGPADLSQVLGKPLRSSTYGGDDLSESVADSGTGTDRDRLPPFAKRLAVIPTVAGDTLYINDGESITAWDRITLTRRWKSDPIPLDPSEQEDSPRGASMFANTRQRNGGYTEELISVAAAGRDVIGATGVPIQGSRTGDPRLHAIDAASGLVRWSINIPDLDPQLAGTSVRGPAILSEGVAVVVARRAELERRQVTIYLVGIDVASGRHLWHRLMGSMGALPYRQDAYVSDAGVLIDGVVYRSDMLGVLGAYEAQTGRPLWVRRVPAESQQFESLAPWHMNVPIVWNDQIVTLSPDRHEVLRVNRDTGAIISRTRADKFGTPNPKYLLRSGDSLVAVSDGGCVLAPLASFETSGIQTISDLGEIGIRGRVASAGDRLLVPTTSGLSIYNPGDLKSPPATIELDNPGNFLALDSQLVVVDDAFVHSYLLWEAAEKVLTERMRTEPAEPSAAVTLAELAYRAGKNDRIIPATDAALESIKLAGDTESAVSSKSRLFDSLHHMATLSMDPVARDAKPTPPEAPATDPAPPAPLAPPAPAIRTAATSEPPRITDTALLAQIVDRLDRAASTSDERVAYLLAKGRLSEQTADFPSAVVAYQSILDSPVLAGATWNGPRLSTRGELEVTRRLERLVRAQGVAVYAQFDALAQSQLDALGATPEPEAVLALATRYPVASVTPVMWERLADVYAADGRGPAVIGALESGLEAAERLPGGPAVARLAGRLFSEMDSRGQLTAASSLLRTLIEDHPDMTVEVGGQLVGVRDLASQLSVRIAARHRWPRVGPATGEHIQVLQGWTLVDPIIRERFGVVPAAIMLKSADQVALWMPSGEIDADPKAGDPAKPGPAAGGAGANSASELAVAWKKPIDNTSLVELIKIDNEAAYVFASSGSTASVEKISLSPARSRWQTEIFSQDVPGAAPPTKPSRIAADERMPTPQDGPSLYTDLLTVLDERTLAFVERTGRACAMDAQSGEALWTIRSPLDRVYDAALSPTALVLSGDQEIIGAGGRSVGWRPEIVVLDPRTGQELQRLSQKWGQVRWIRLTDSGDLIAGCDQAVVSTDLSRVQTNWVLSDHRVVNSRDAWVFGDTLFLLDRDRELWTLTTTSGELSKEALAAPRAHLGGLRAIQAYSIPQSTKIAAAPPAPPVNPAAPPEPPAPPVLPVPAPPPAPAIAAAPPAANVAFTTFQGVMIYGLDGSFKGIDAVGGFDGLVPPLPSESSLVTITTMPDGRRGDGELIYTLHYLDTTTAILQESVPIVLGAPPRSFTLMDGRLILTAGGTTLVLQSPRK